MRISEYYEDEKKDYALYIYVSIIMIAVVVCVVGLIFLTNRPKGTAKGFQLALAQSSKSSELQRQTKEVVDSVDQIISGSTLTSDQLDIWTLPETGREVIAENDQKNGILKNKTTGEVIGQLEETPSKKEEVVVESQIEEETEEIEEAAETDKKLFADGKIEVALADGSSKTIKIDDSLARNEYDVKKFQLADGIMQYLDGEETLSAFGVDISSKSGAVNFTTLKRTGCEYVMVQVGHRGYASGKIVMDAAYEDHIEKALKAKLGVGLYFNSQAITKEEVLEEADCLLSIADEYKITYPVMFDMENVNGDIARADGLSKETRTELVNIFLERMKKAGYQPMLYGNKEWLLTQIDLTQIKDCDVCYAEKGDVPAYPYQFSMWQYDENGVIKGVENNTRLFTNLKKYE